MISARRSPPSFRASRPRRSTSALNTSKRAAQKAAFAFGYANLMVTAGQNRLPAVLQAEISSSRGLSASSPKGRDPTEMPAGDQHHLGGRHRVEVVGHALVHHKIARRNLQGTAAPLPKQLLARQDAVIRRLEAMFERMVIGLFLPAFARAAADSAAETNPSGAPPPGCSARPGSLRRGRIRAERLPKPG